MYTLLMSSGRCADQGWICLICINLLLESDSDPKFDLLTCAEGGVRRLRGRGLRPVHLPGHGGSQPGRHHRHASLLRGQVKCDIDNYMSK